MLNFRTNQQDSNYRQSSRANRYLGSIILVGIFTSVMPMTQAAPPLTATSANKSAVKKPIKVITDVTTYAERDWRSDDGQFLLTLYSAVWNPHGTLFYLNKDDGVSVEGFQKGLNNENGSSAALGTQNQRPHLSHRRRLFNHYHSNGR